jgi:cytochrome c2
VATQVPLSPALYHPRPLFASDSALQNADVVEFHSCMRRLELFLLVCVLFLAGCRKEYQSGQAAFEGECRKCHKLNGEGGTKGPDLTGIFSKKDEDYIRRFTTDPRSIKPDGTMPPSKLSDHELNLLIQYMKEQNRPGSKVGARETRAVQSPEKK